MSERPPAASPARALARGPPFPSAPRRPRGTFHARRRANDDDDDTFVFSPRRVRIVRALFPRRWSARGDATTMRRARGGAIARGCEWR